MHNNEEKYYILLFIIFFILGKNNRYIKALTREQQFLLLKSDRRVQLDSWEISGNWYSGEKEVNLESGQNDGSEVSEFFACST